MSALDWFGDSVALPSVVQGREVLVSRRSVFEGERLLYLIAGAPPADFVMVGVSIPMGIEARSSKAFIPWEGLRTMLLMEDLWERDRETYEARVNASRVETDKLLETWRAGGPRETTWSGMETGRHFRGWRKMPKGVVQAARRLIQEAARELHAMSVGDPEGNRIDVIRRCVERFNELDEANGYFIETVEAEDVMNRLGQLAKLSGLGPADRLADKWRRW